MALSARAGSPALQECPVPATRLLSLDDAPAVAELLRRNRGFLAPWQPIRDEHFFTDDGQRESLSKALTEHGEGRCMPLGIQDASGAVVGAITLTSIIRGAFQSCSVGYWLAEDAQGQGLATAALREAVALAFQELGLHRVQAETLTHNTRSQRVLERLGFVRYGEAPAYLKIAGEWQDHVLYQLLTPTPEVVVTG